MPQFRSTSTPDAPAPSARRRAFTLVVLLILGLLISLLFPVINAARLRANSVACKSNLHTIGQGIRMYLNENRGRYPRAPSLPSVNPKAYPTLMRHLLPYVGRNEEVFHCPADDELFPIEKTSYFYNAQLGTDPLENNVFFQVFKSKQYVPVALDADEFHGKAKPINILFLDGRVEQIERPKGVP